MVIRKDFPNLYYNKWYLLESEWSTIIVSFLHYGLFVTQTLVSFRPNYDYPVPFSFFPYVVSPRLTFMKGFCNVDQMEISPLYVSVTEDGSRYIGLNNVIRNVNLLKH